MPRAPTSAIEVRSARSVLAGQTAHTRFSSHLIEPLCNAAIPVVSSVLVDERCPRTRVAEAGHQFLRRGAGARRQRAGGVSEVVEAQLCQPDGLSGRDPDPVAEVAALQRLSRR